VYITMSVVLSAAVDDGRIIKNPCKASSVKAPSQPHQKIIPWTAAQVRAVRSELPERYQAMADCGAGLGLRQGEILGLAVDAVDFLRHEVHVRRQVKRVGGRLWLGPPRAAGSGRCRCPRRWRSRWPRKSRRTRQLR
jgi:integrase